MLVVAPLLFTSVTARSNEILPPVQPLAAISTDFVVARHTPDYDKEILLPLHTAQETAHKAADDALAVKAADDARLAREAADTVAEGVVVTTTGGEQAETPSFDITGELTGTIGYALPYGNCVDEAGVNNPGWGNPIDWPILTQTPAIGATALFYFNHVAVVTGIWSNGDIEIRHQNVTGGVHRYPRSAFRGFR